jgi:hypothetical protein
MTGGNFVGLILVSMAALFFIGGLVVNWTAFRQQTTRKEGERAWSSMGPFPGIVGSLMLFFFVPALAKYGLDVPWPWLWILLPLVLDPYCLGRVFLVLLGRR